MPPRCHRQIGHWHLAFSPLKESKKKLGQKMRKNIPTELLFEIIGAIPIDSKWAQIHVSQVFNHFLFNRMGSWLSQIKNLIAKCTFLVRSIVKMIRTIPDNLLLSNVIPIKQLEAQIFYKDLLYFIGRWTNCSRIFPELIGLPLNSDDPNYINQLLIIVAESVSICCTWAHITVDDLQLLGKFLSDYALCISNKYFLLLFGRRFRNHQNLLSAIEIVSHCGTCANTTADELRSFRISLCCHALKRLHERQYIIYDF